VNQTIRNVYQHVGYSDSRCELIYPPISSGTIQLKKYGDTYMKDTSSLNLYTGEKFSGIESESFPTSNINMNASSYWFTGSRYVWLLYPSSNYRGSPTCLEPSYTVKQLGWGHTYAYSSQLTVGSIKRSDTCFYSGAVNLNVVPWAFSLILISSFVNFLFSN